MYLSVYYSTYWFGIKSNKCDNSSYGKQDLSRNTYYGPLVFLDIPKNKLIIDESGFTLNIMVYYHLVNKFMQCHMNKLTLIYKI